MTKRRDRIYKLTLDAILIGLYIALTMVRIRLGFLEIGAGSLVTTIAAVLVSPFDGFFVGAIGEFIYQVFFSGYGITPTTALWVLPVALRPLIVGIAARKLEKKGKPFVSMRPAYFITLGLTALFISLLDTGIIYLDGLIMGYPISYTVLQNFFRVISSQATAILVSFILIPLYGVLCKVYGRKGVSQYKEEEE